MIIIIYALKSLSQKELMGNLANLLNFLRKFIGDVFPKPWNDPALSDYCEPS